MTQSAFTYNNIQGGLGRVDVNQMERNAKRDYLQKRGFVWQKTSGIPEGEEWNIDNYGNVALQSMIDAEKVYGAIVAEMHNLKKFNRISAQNYNTVVSLIEEELKRRKEAPPFPDQPDQSGNGNGNDSNESRYTDETIEQILTWIDTQNQPGNSSTQGIPQNWILGGTLAAGGLVLLLLIR